MMKVDMSSYVAMNSADKKQTPTDTNASSQYRNVTAVALLTKTDAATQNASSQLGVDT